MKALIGRSILLDALNVSAKVGRSDHSLLPILSTTRIDADHGTFKLTTTDLDITVHATAEARVTDPGVILPPTKELLALIKQLPDGDIEFETTKERIIVRAGRSTYRLPNADVDDYPVIKPRKVLHEVEMSGADFTDLIERTYWAVSGEESRPILNGVLWEFEKDRTLHMTATSGYMLAHVSEPKVGPAKLKDDIEVIIKPEILKLVASALKGDALSFQMCTTGDEGANDLSVVRFVGGWITVEGRTIEGPYPNYRQVIPKDNDKVWETSRIAAIAACKRLAIVNNSLIVLSLGASAEPPKKKETGKGKKRGKNANSGSAGPDLIAVGRWDAESPDQGEGHEIADGTYEGEPIRIGVDPSYMLDILESINTSRVRVSFRAPERAIVVQPVMGDGEIERDILTLVMPKRILE